MKGFIEIRLVGNSNPHIINVQTIASVWCNNASTGASTIKLIAKDNDGKDVLLYVPDSVYHIKGLMEDALKPD